MVRRTLALLAAASCSLWAASPVAGDWIGTLKAGPTELRLILHVTEADGKLSATFDSINQGAKGISIESVTFSGNQFTFSSNTVNGKYEGKYDPAKAIITGTWTQSGSMLITELPTDAMPLTFEHYVEKPKPARTGPPAKPSDIDGAWEGKVDAGGEMVRLVFYIKTDEEGALTGTTESPDQDTHGLSVPLTSVTREGATVRIEIKGVGASYKGTLNDAKSKIDGTLTQGGELPLLLERKPAAKP